MLRCDGLPRQASCQYPSIYCDFLQTLPRIDILLATPDYLTIPYGVQEVRPLEVMNVQQASVSELSLQDAWRAESSWHSKGLLIKVGNWCWPDFK